MLVVSQPAIATSLSDLWLTNTRYPSTSTTSNGYRYVTPNVTGINYGLLGTLTTEYAPIYGEINGIARISKELSDGKVEITISNSSGSPLRIISPLVRASLRPDFFTTKQELGPRGIVLSSEVVYNNLSVNSDTLLGLMDLDDYVDNKFDEYYTPDVAANQDPESLSLNDTVQPTGTITPLGEAPVLYSGSTTSGTSPSPVMDTSGTEASSVMGALSGSSYCSDSARLAISSQREKVLQDKENLRTTTFSDILNIGNISCFDMYQLTMFNDIANTLSNTGGFFDSAIGNVGSSLGIPAGATSGLSSYATDSLSDYLTNSACEASQNLVADVQSSLNSSTSALYSSVQSYGDDTWWGGYLTDNMPELEDEYFESATLGTYYDYGSDFLTQAVDTYSEYRDIYQDAYDNYDPVQDDGGQ